MKIKVKITTLENQKYFNCSKDTIKEIELEDYIAAVVASEVGNAPLEACKAQAIASRSFAVARGVLEGNVISDSAAVAQAYRAPRNNYINCNKAAEETAGQILTYEGKVATTYFCHSNGGRTYSSKEVWGGYKPYLVSAFDGWTATTGIGKNGHGIGLSQVGAIEAATEAVSCREILQFYFPSTKIEKIKLNQENYNGIVNSLKQQLIEAIKKIGEAL